MRSTPAGPGVNRLLQGLPAGDLARMLGDYDTVELVVADVLYSPGDRLRDVHFPLDGYVALIAGR